MMVPVASAPPQHMATRPRSRRGVRARAGSVVISRLPVAPDRVAEGDGPAVHVDLVHVGLVHLGPGAAPPRRRPRSPRRGRCRPSSCRPWPAPWPSRRWAVEVVVGVGAHEHLGHDPRPGPEALGPGPLLGHPQHGGRAVGDLRRVPGRVDPVGQHRLELGQALGRRVAGPLVLADTTIVSPVCSPRGPSSPTTGASTEKISRSKRPSATARAAFFCDRARARRRRRG